MAVNLPTFADREKLTAGKLNLLRDAIENKFSAITGADLTWPLVAQGHIDMGGLYSIIGLKTFWNVVNADEYTTLQAAVDAVAPGGCVFIPPKTTVIADGVDIGGSDVTIMGCGASSVIQLTTSSSSGYLLRATNLNDIGLVNLTLDGQNTGTGQKGVIARKVTRFHMARVWVKNFTGDAVQLTNDGTNGNACIDASLTDVWLSGGSADHIASDDVDGFQLLNAKSVDCGAKPIDFEPSTAAGLIKRIQISNFDVEDPAEELSILGFSGTASDNHSMIQLTGVRVEGATVDALVLGATAKTLKHTLVSNVSAITPGGDGLNIVTAGGSVDNFYCPDAGANGFDSTGSDDLIIGTLAVPPADIVDAVVHTGAFVAVNDTEYTIATGGANPKDSTYSLTIPANTVKDGDIIRIRAHWEWAWASGTAGGAAYLDGQTINGFQNAGAAGKGMAEYTVFIGTLTGANNTYAILDFVSSVAASVGAAATSPFATVDWTADVELTFARTSDPGADVQLHGVTVEVLGGV